MFRFALDWKNLRVKAILNSAWLVHRLQDHVTPLRPNNHFYLVSNDLNMTWIIIKKYSLMISERAANIVSCPFRDGLILSFCAMTLLIMLGRDAGSHWLDLTCSGRMDMLSMSTEQNILSHHSAHTDAHTSGRVEGPILCFLSEKHHRLYTADISLCCLRRRRDEKWSLMYNSDLWIT